MTDTPQTPGAGRPGGSPLRDRIATALLAYDYPAEEWPDGPPGEGEMDTAREQANVVLAALAEADAIPPEELRQIAQRAQCADVHRLLDAYLTLLAERDRLREQVAAVRGLHRPFGVYEPCGHEDEDDCTDPIQLSDGTWTCGPLLYAICESCCLDPGDQRTEDCEENHEHGPGQPHCWTIAEMDRVVGR